MGQSSGKGKKDYCGAPELAKQTLLATNDAAWELAQRAVVSARLARGEVVYPPGVERQDPPLAANSAPSLLLAIPMEHFAQQLARSRLERAAQGIGNGKQRGLHHLFVGNVQHISL